MTDVDTCLAVSPSDVFEARRRLQRHLSPTPLVRHPLLDEALGTSLWVKLENAQPIGAFKIRGGLNLVESLGRERLQAGICAPTRGNHGQGLAYAARAVGVRCTLFVPDDNNPEKNAAMLAFGADVRRAGANFDQACLQADAFAAATSARLVHPGHEPALIAGAGTLALEIFDALEGGLDDIFVPVGVGSLASGVALAASIVSPRTRVRGVSALAARAMHDAFHSGEMNSRPVSSTLADGLAVGVPIDTTLAIMRRHVCSMQLVDESALRHAIELYAGSVHQLAEGAGAAALAGALQMRDELRGRRVGVVLSGGNIDRATLASITRARPSRSPVEP